MSSRRRLVALLGAGFAAMAVAAGGPGIGPAVATTHSSGGGAVVQYGWAAFVDDGDTLDVKIDHVAADPGRAGTRIRFLGTQAMELHTYHVDLNQVTGECHAVEAAKRLKQLVFNDDGTGRRVRLTARERSSSNLGREARFIAIQGTDGKWHDVGATMIGEGQAIPSYQRVEYTRNKSYRKLAEAAAAKGIGIWNTSFCGSGPAADLAVHVNWDASGDDSVNVDGEYVKISNRGTSTVQLGGWWVRDSATRPGATKTQTRRGYIFPAGASVAAGSSVYVHIGKAPAHRSAGNYYYGLSSPIFENVTAKPSYLGDGGYLFDPDGNLRGWQQYPCWSSAPRACVG